jgi:hypothetical protein
LYGCSGIGFVLSKCATDDFIAYALIRLWFRRAINGDGLKGSSNNNGAMRMLIKQR